MATGDAAGPVSPYLKRPTRSLEMVLAKRFEIPCPTDEVDERRKTATVEKPVLSENSTED